MSLRNIMGNSYTRSLGAPMVLIPYKRIQTYQKHVMSSFLDCMSVTIVTCIRCSVACYCIASASEHFITYKSTWQTGVDNHTLIILYLHYTFHLLY